MIANNQTAKTLVLDIELGIVFLIENVLCRRKQTKFSG